MYQDFLKALATGGSVDLARERLEWKTRQYCERLLSTIQQQAALAEQLKLDLKEPEDTARFKLATSYLAEAQKLLEEEDEDDRQARIAREALEAEYSTELKKRLEYERLQAERRTAKRGKEK